jgi:2-desacetyl-2-hydroxyethyl bacteriochlorophyllide A dehydrogenase
MLAAQITAPGQTRVIEATIPEPGPDEVLIRVRAAGICGTDLHILHGTYEATYPITPGHEFSGEVAAVGANVTRYRAGDRVTADPNIPCGKCPFCQRNEPNQCKTLQAVGVTRNGAFAEYVSVPQSVVFPIGDLSYAAAALVEPLACVVWGLKRINVQPGDSALVFGAGPMGVLVMQALRSAGAARVVVTETVQSRLDMARQLGASATIPAGDQQADHLGELAPLGYDIVVDATGIPAVLQQCFDYVRPRGRVWVFGVCPPDSQVAFDPYTVFRKDLSIIGSFAVNRTFPESIALIQGGAINVEALISHRLPLAEFAGALHLAEHDPGRMKVQFAL